MNSTTKSFMTALVFVAAVVVSSAAHAQKGSRVCGPFHPGLGMAFVIEGGWTGKSNNQRNKIDDACRTFMNEVLSANLLSATNTSKGDLGFLKRAECEDAASEISSGGSRADICDLMPRGEPHKVMFQGGSFTAEKLDN